MADEPRNPQPEIRPCRQGCAILSPAAPAVPRADVNSRLIAGAIALVAWAVLAVSSGLRVDGRGFGTHEGLGLPACNFQVVTGHPCPTCGMTTSFAAFMQGRLWDALRAQVFGTVLAAATLLAALGATVTAGTGADLSPVIGRLFARPRLWIWWSVGLAAVSWAIKWWTMT